MKLNSLRFKLIWIQFAIFAIAAVCFGLLRYQLAGYSYQQRFDATLIRDAELFLSRLQKQGVEINLNTDGLSPRDALLVHDLEHYFFVTDPAGRIVHEDLHNRFVRHMFEPRELDGILQQHSGFSWALARDGSRYRFHNISAPSGLFPQPALVHVGRSMEMHRGVMREYLLFYVYSVPIILVIAALLAWFLTGRSLKPFEEITRTAEKINFENLNMQITTEHTEEEIQRLVQSFNSMVRRLDASFQQMRKFNADAAHELRTPLAILQGETEVALQSPNLPEEIRSLLASNLEELDRLTRIVNDLLVLAEADAGRQVLVKEPLNLGALLEDLVDQMRLLASDRNLAIALRSAPDLWIYADKLWIRRAVLNILDNAIKYSKAGGTVEVTAGRDESTVTLCIQDRGIGIARDDLSHIFDRLYRADPARSRGSGGAGLGLALVKWIVEAHGGTIRVESEPDRGALFEIGLPVSISSGPNFG